jgi:hypothetical protein
MQEELAAHADLQLSCPKDKDSRHALLRVWRLSIIIIVRRREIPLVFAAGRAWDAYR